MRFYIILRSDPVLGMLPTAWNELIELLLQQTMCSIIERFAKGAHEHFSFNVFNKVYSHLLLGDVEINNPIAISTIQAQAEIHSIVGTLDEKFINLLLLELKNSAIQLGYDAEFFSIKWHVSGLCNTTISETHAWLDSNEALMGGLILDGWTKPIREQAYCGAQYIQVAPTQYNVTTLADSGSGSLREALNVVGEREIHFSVPGNIIIETRIDPEPGFLVDGSDAPAGGICIQNHPSMYGGTPIFVYKGNGGIFRHLRFRPGYPGGYNDACQGLLVGRKDQPIKNILLDHCSFSWATDACSDVDGINVTYRDCIFSEPLAAVDGYGKGSVARGGYTSYLRCLWAHIGQRSPKVAIGSSDIQIINNVFYNGRQFINLARESYPEFEIVDLIGNYFKFGPDSGEYPEVFHLGNRIGGLLLYVWDNIGPHIIAQEDIVGTGKSYVSFETEPQTIPDRNPMSAKDTYTYVLTNAGATLPKRDAVDARIVQDVINGTGQHIQSQESVGGWPDLTL